MPSGCRNRPGGMMLFYYSLLVVLVSQHLQCTRTTVRAQQTTSRTTNAESSKDDTSLMDYHSHPAAAALSGVFQAWKRTLQSSQRILQPRSTVVKRKTSSPTGSQEALGILRSDKKEDANTEDANFDTRPFNSIQHKVGHAMYEEEESRYDDDHHQGNGGYDDGTSSLYRNLEYYHGIEYKERAHRDFVHSFAGMKLHVFGLKDNDDEEKKKAFEAERDETMARSTRRNLPAPPEAQESRSHHPPQQWPSAHLFQWENTYQLLEPMHMELGIPPKHYWDYAYTPVYNYYQHPTSTIGGVSHEATSTINEPPDTCLVIAQQGTKDVEATVATASFTALETDSSSSSLPSSLPSENRDSWWNWWFAFGSPWWRSNQQSEYTTSRTAFAGGSHGQVWRGRRVCDHRQPKSPIPTMTDDRECDEDKPLILKRLKVEQGYRLLEAGLREVYFGQWIRELSDEIEKDLFTTYVDHFFRELPRSDGSKSDLELWIVFDDAGPSLRSYIYAPITSSGGFVMYQHSPLWAQLRMSTSRKGWKPSRSDDGEENGGIIEVRAVPDSRGNETTSTPATLSGLSLGREMLRTVLKQIIGAASVLHEGGIVHRDIKPSNVMCVSDEPLDDLYTLSSLPTIHCRLGDFSSGWNDYTNDNLYTKGPSPAEQTDEYAPPESYIDPQWKPFDERSPQSYDSWSIGVLALELLLGTPNVFSVDQRTTVLLTSKMKKEGASDDDVQRALYLAALSQFCIYVPSSHDKKEHSSWPYRQGDPLHNTAMAKDSCTMQDFHRALRARDPLGMGFDSSIDLLLHLIWQLLAWDPIERITAAEALLHPFFLSPDGTREALDLIPGRHNALESQMLDPRMDFVVDDSVDEFVCPKCGRTFADWHSCHAHATSRRHAKFCTYDRTHLPSCINTHSMLPAHPTSGYCDLQGRRPTIEDFHSIHLYPEIQFYGIFDGHTGNVASKYAASTLFDRLVLHLPELGVVTTQHTMNGSSDWKVLVEQNVSRAYQETHESFLDALTFAPSMDQSGTTATALMVTKHAIVLSSLGDSRAVLSSTDESGNLRAVQLTIDHVASDPMERDLVLERGGLISSTANGLARVNGTLAITRSIGDAALASMLSRRPHVTSMKWDEIQDLCGSIYRDLPCFVILASDGLWDVMTNQEAVDMVAQVVNSYDATDHVSRNHGGAFQEAAEVLAVDAFVRGSTDNIGVCVVAIA